MEANAQKLLCEVKTDRGSKSVRSISPRVVWFAVRDFDGFAASFIVVA